MRNGILLMLMAATLSGCGSFLLSAGTTTGVSIAENRSIGRKVDDTVIYSDLTNQFLQAHQNDLLAQVSFNVRFSRVMLTGQVKTEDAAREAVALSWKAKGVTEVINELIVNPDANLLGTAEDSLIKRNLEARLLITKGVWVINYSIDVQQGVAYLIGRVKDQAELNRALNITRTTKGVKRVVSHLQINPDTSHPVTSHDPNATPQESSDITGGQGATSIGGYDSNASSSGGSDIYTGPVYGGGSISSAPLKPSH